MKSENESELFKCKKCGNCCKGYGGTFVTFDDIVKISTHINADPASFVEEYCQISGNRPLIGQGKKGYCLFWNNICVIHPVKPRMCRAWPFIKSVLTDIRNWRIMSESCPGIRADVPDSVVRKRIRQELKWRRD